MPYDMQPKAKHVPRNGLYPPKVYRSTHLYIVDDIDPNAQPRRGGRRGGRVDSHTYKCNTIREFFRDYTNVEIHSVRFPQGTRGNGFLNYWREELATKSTDDLVIVYFHGSAGGEDEDYKWSLTQYPRIQINAYNLIHIINRSNADSLILIDGFIQTRFTERWKCTHGNLEIIASPAKMQTPDGRVMEHDGDFTEAMIDNLECFVEGINGVFIGHKKMKSIPDIMRADDGVYSNPIRIQLNRTKYLGKQVIKRFRICPERIRERIRRDPLDIKLDFVTVIVQGPPEDELADMIRQLAEERRLAHEAAIANNQFDDEGFEDMDDGSAGSSDDDDANGGGGRGAIAGVEVEEANGAEEEAAAVDGDETMTDNGNAGDGGIEEEDPDLFIT